LPGSYRIEEKFYVVGKNSKGETNLNTGISLPARGLLEAYRLCKSGSLEKIPLPNLDLIRHFTRVLPVVMEVRFKISSFSKCLLAVLCFLTGITEGRESYIAVESYSGKIVLELNADKRRPVASLTKIATAMVVLGLGLN
jgi:hypothetical protein